MLKFMRAIEAQATTDKVACQLEIPGKVPVSLSYRDLWNASDCLAQWLVMQLGDNRAPLIVYGHKHPYMLVYFLACLKSGHAYCPVDISMPLNRVQTIVATVQPPLILTTETLSLDIPQLTLSQARDLVARGWAGTSHPDWAVQGFETAYIIYTSGSTGQPKGVCVSADNLDAFLTWYLPLIEPEADEVPVFIGQPPYSFDLSVMSCYPALCQGATLVQLDKQLQDDYAALFHTLAQSQVTTWISTPSFVDTCLVDPAFSQALLPQLRRFAFCGEKLQTSTVRALQSRFPQACIYNSYGPTESTVMMTWIELTPDLVTRYADNLPVGRVRPGSQVKLLPLADAPDAPDGQGEIQIIGDTVAQGYYGQPALTAEKFGQVGGQLAYRTGDVGYWQDGFLFVEGRLDFQVKLHGYRIELEDIDVQLLRQDHVSQALTLPRYEGDRVKHLVSFLVYGQPITARFETVRKLKAGLKAQLPDYMIPKKIVFLDAFPLNQNGKVDRKALEAQL